MRCTSTEGRQNFRPSYRQSIQNHITVCQVNTVTHEVHWLSQMYWAWNFLISNAKQKVNNSESHGGIVCLQSLLRHYNCLADKMYTSCRTRSDMMITVCIKYIQVPTRCEQRVTLNLFTEAYRLYDADSHFFQN